MDPAWAAPAACSADTLAVPRTPASSPPSVGRVQIAAPPPAGSSPPRTPLVAPARIVPPASSLRPPLPLHGKWAIAAGFLLRRNRSIRLLREGFSLRRSHQSPYVLAGYCGAARGHARTRTARRSPLDGLVCQKPARSRTQAGLNANS